MKLFLAIIAGITLIGAACADDAEEVVPDEVATTPSQSGAFATFTPAAHSPTPTIRPTRSPPASPSLSPVAEVIRFTHEKYGYSFDYPGGWIVDPNATDEYLALYREYPGTGADKIEFVTLDNAERLPLDEWVRRHLESSPSQPEVESTSDLPLEGGAGINQILSAQGFTFHAAYLAIGDKVLLVNGPWVDSSMAADREELLTTLRTTQ